MSCESSAVKTGVEPLVRRIKSPYNTAIPPRLRFHTPSSQEPTMRSGNPALERKDVRNRFTPKRAAVANAMTVQGTAWKTLILLGLCAGTACFTWTAGHGAAIRHRHAVGHRRAIGGLIVGLITSFKPPGRPSPRRFTRLLEGLFLGGISAMFELRYPGHRVPGDLRHVRHAVRTAMAYQSGLIAPRRTSSSASSRRPAASASCTSSRS